MDNQESEPKTEKEVAKGSKWNVKGIFKDKENLILIGILVFAFIIRLYYLVITKSQPFWWDESEYLSIAKHWVKDIPLDVNPQRTIMFPALISFFYLLGFNELIIKFFIVLIPSTLIVLVTYLLGKELYDKKVGLISAFIMAVFWLLIFNTARIHTDALAMVLSIFSIYNFWKYYEKTKKGKHLILAGLSLALAVMTRPFTGIYIFLFGIYLILVKRLNFVKDKNLWLALIVGIIGFLPLLIYDYLQFGSFTTFIVHATGQNPQGAWEAFGFFKWFSEWLFFIIFLLGLALLLFNLVIGFDYVLKDSSLELKADFFNILWILIYLVYFVFILRNLPEDRWLMPMAVPMFFIIAKCLNFIYLFVKRYSRYLAIFFIIIVLFYGGYLQLKHADSIIKIKINTYSQEPAAGKWLKENTLSSDILMSNNEQLPLTYYTERKVYGMGGDDENGTVEVINEEKPKFLILTAYYPSPQWTFEFPEKYKEHLTPVQVFMEDNRPVIIIYQFNDYNL